MPIAIFALAIGAFAICTSEFVIMGLLLDVARDLHISISGAGFLVTGYAMGVVVGAPLLTPFLARLPRKPVLIGLMGLFAVGNLACAVAPNYELLLLARLVTALAQATFFGLGAVVAASLVAPDRQASAISTMFLGATIANILGAPAGTVIGQWFGWRTTFAAVAAIGVLAAIAIAMLVPHLKRSEDHNFAKELRTLTQASTLRALLITVLGFGGTFTAFTYIAPMLTEITGLNAKFVAPLLLLFGLGMTIGNPVGGRLADRNLMGALRLTLGALIAVLALIGVLMHSTIAMVILVFLFGAAMFATIAPLQMNVMTYAKDAPVLASAFNIAAFNLGNAGGAWLGGVAIDHGLGLTNLPWVAALVSVVGLLLSLTVRREALAPTGMPQKG
ncbi:MFS transporter [Burkholderia ambifaria]|jgi:DHA1 family inner membrane transport protein|uniref:MFS transporter n=2 Tax=Burkholderia ambifaria TaxID=152480 RepID=A0AA41E6P1_9BURK|nr:MFS transporter [Burkholderia ambifaria]EDT03406.1 major facilitator superfamily MFS_1 [Burkholderia ambifaria IOP40-10]MBR8129389.1 MFS transporter [Burkholderia ambifaria]PRD93628.1 MFS transporter [Burkholderia ambifaria]UEP52194.1 MFS transporter [Burkholderia ambifaria]